MLTSCERFFDIPELLGFLAEYLDKKDLSRLSRTRREMARDCASLLFRTLDLHDREASLIFTSIACTLALAKNARHVRTLALGEHELVYYYNCVLALEEINSQASDNILARPPWHPLPDIRTCQLVPLPPMTRLSRLTVNLVPSKNRAYTMPSVGDHRTKLAQLCWLVSLNPGLVSLDLERILIKDQHCCRLLGRVIAGLTELKRLDLELRCRKSEMFRLGSFFFFTCPLSVRQLHMSTTEGFWSDVEEDFGELGELESWPSTRQEPLSYLEDLKLWDVTKDTSTSDVLAVLKQCPSIRKLEIPLFKGQRDIEVIGQFVGKECPKIESLIYGSYRHKAHHPLPFRILGSLPAQQISKFSYTGPLSNFINPAVNSSLLRHSTTLRSIRIDNLAPMDRLSLSAVFRECSNLEELELEYFRVYGHYITLDEALSCAWSCSRLKYLTLSISGCHLPVEPGVRPYYSRPTPVTLTHAETQHFTRLERLYRQIGSLTHMRVLDMAMVTIDEHGRVDEGTYQGATSFPGILSLGDIWAGQPGYLRLFAGLNKLEGLRGSFHADADETKAITEWPEVTWMDENWPRLIYAEFFVNEKDVTAPFAWLKDRRKYGREALRLGLFLAE